MSPEKFEALKENIISQLRSNLLPGLYYHSPEHTLDVIKASERIGIAEKISDTEMMLLKIAALFHDSGYLFSAKNHEEKSCRITRSILPSYGLQKNEIDIICALIMATKVPHNPKNILEKIICDADLDYLGRDDFSELSQNLFKEMKTFDKVNDANKWNEMQIIFFEKHTYFTDTSKALRDPLKDKHLSEIRNLIEKS